MPTIPCQPKQPIVSKEKLVDLVWQQNQALTKKDVHRVVTAFLDAMRQQVLDGRRVRLVGYLSASLRHYPARQTYSTSLGKAVTTPARDRVVIQAKF